MLAIRLIVITMIGATVVTLGVAWSRTRDASALASASVSTGLPAPAFAISSTAVQRQRLPERVSAVGTVMPWQELVMSAQASGLAVVEVRVDENDRVSSGELLIRLDDRILNAQISQQKALIAEAEANLVSATQKLDRGNKLIVTQAVSSQTVDDERTAVAVSQAKLDQMKAQLDQLVAQLAQTRITAPVDGYVSQKPVVVGSVVQPGTELVRIVRDGRLEIEAKIPEQQVALVQAGQPASFAEAGEPEARQTRVRAAAAKVDPKTRLGLIYVTVPPGAHLKPGMFAKVAIDVADRDVLVVPEQALVWRDGRSGVFVVNADSRVGFKEVVTKTRSGGLVAIESELGEGERVALSGAGFLNDGDKVRVAVAEADNARTEFAR
jgi:RND family efflux transporter MFP subunit